MLGSTTLGLLMRGTLDIDAMQNGWIRMAPVGAQAKLSSLPSSLRIDLATGQMFTGAHTFHGLPVIGFSLRTFSNGTLSCAGAPACQGNYGGAFPLAYRRAIGFIP